MPGRAMLLARRRTAAPAPSPAREHRPPLFRAAVCWRRSTRCATIWLRTTSSLYFEGVERCAPHSLCLSRSLPGLAPRRHGANDPQALAQHVGTRPDQGRFALDMQEGQRTQASDEPSEAEEEDRGEQQDGGGGHGHVAPPDGDASPKLARLQPATAAPAQRPGRLPSTHGCDSAPVQAHQVRTLAQREAYLSDARCLARKLAGVYDSAPHSTA